MTLAGTGHTWNMTEHMTVLPITPSLAGSQQDGILNLTWPQNATDYEVETTSRLDRPNWLPAGQPVHTVEGVFKMSAPLSPGSQFFRLHLH